jgi:hypothetical protein
MQDTELGNDALELNTRRPKEAIMVGALSAKVLERNVDPGWHAYGFLGDAL